MSRTFKTYYCCNTTTTTIININAMNPAVIDNVHGFFVLRQKI